MQIIAEAQNWQFLKACPDMLYSLLLEGYLWLKITHDFEFLMHRKQLSILWSLHINRLPLLSQGCTVLFHSLTWSTGFFSHLRSTQYCKLESLIVVICRHHLNWEEFACALRVSWGFPSLVVSMVSFCQICSFIFYFIILRLKTVVCFFVDSFYFLIFKKIFVCVVLAVPLTIHSPHIVFLGLLLYIYKSLALMHRFNAVERRFVFALIIYDESFMYLLHRKLS